MIYILHGDDANASYQRFNSILEKFKDIPKINLNKDATLEEFIKTSSDKDLFNTKKLIVCNNLLNKINFKDTANIDPENIVIFYEQGKIKQTLLNKFSKNSLIEEFKPKADIFYFLDSLSPNFKNSLILLKKLEDTQPLIWQISNRVLLLILAKLNKSIEETQKTTSGRLQSWQWDKLKHQSTQFTLNQLLAFFNGILKLDYSIKKGLTAIDTKTLITVLLLKYLRI